VLGKRPHELAVDGDPFLARLHLAGEPAEYGVVLQQMREGGRVDQVVDGHDLDLGIAPTRCAQHAPSDAAEAVDANTHGHDYLISWLG